MTNFRMRKQRACMIQTHSQYTFVYEALVEQTLFGNTEIETSELSDWLNEKNQPMPGGVTGITHEVGKLTFIYLRIHKA